MDILNGSEKCEDSREYLQTAGRRSVVDAQGEDIAFTDLLRIHSAFFFSLGFLCLIHPAEHLRGIR
jgi:hypothetical protein